MVSIVTARNLFGNSVIKEALSTVNDTESVLQWTPTRKSPSCRERVLLVDGFQETIGVMQKPLGGLLSNLPGYSGLALMGDGSILMILNLQEIV